MNEQYREEFKIGNLAGVIKKEIKKQCQECKERTERERETEERERENE